MDIFCIGARTLTHPQLALCRWIGERLLLRGHRLLTGNGSGGDDAFQQGGNAVDPLRVLITLPWPRFNVPALHPHNPVTVVWSDERLRALVASVCPLESKPVGVQKLLLRDASLVHQSECVIAFPGEGDPRVPVTGKLAESAGRPWLDLSLPDHLEALVGRLETLPC